MKDNEPVPGMRTWRTIVCRALPAHIRNFSCCRASTIYIAIVLCGLRRAPFVGSYSVTPGWLTTSLSLITELQVSKMSKKKHLGRIIRSEAGEEEKLNSAFSLSEGSQPHKAPTIANAPPTAWGKKKRGIAPPSLSSSTKAGKDTVLRMICFDASPSP